jgi:hypothetical protein
MNAATIALAVAIAVLAGALLSFWLVRRPFFEVPLPPNATELLNGAECRAWLDANTMGVWLFGRRLDGEHIIAFPRRREARAFREHWLPDVDPDAVRPTRFPH